MSTPTPSEIRGADHLKIAFWLSVAAWAAMSVQEVLLFARATPYGGDYVDHWDRYFFHALLFNWIAVTVPVLPIWVVWASKYRTNMSWSRWRRLHLLELGVLAAMIALDQVDNEVMRFMGTHLTFGLLLTYADTGAFGHDTYLAVSMDRGGAWLPFVVLFGVPGLFVWAGRKRLVPMHQRPAHRWPTPVLFSALLVPLCLPLGVYGTKGGQFRKVRARPAIVTIVVEFFEDLDTGKRPDAFERIAAAQQAHWFEGAASSEAQAWEFVDPEYPLLRRPLQDSTPAPEQAWNVIYLQLESFRGWEMGFLRPELDPSPTPFLDELAKDSAYWVRHLSFGPPTVGGFIAGHCSVPPHSRHNITNRFTYTRLRCLPAVLREHGYRAEFFTGTDPDWDGETFWLKQWYDDYHYFREADEADRDVFRRAAERIVEMGARGTPFMATVVSVSNHYPFSSRDTALDIAGAERVQDRIRNTTHYTDDVVREFIETLAREPWFRHTLVVIVGDHAYNLGEHDNTPGQRHGYREATWVPLVIHAGGTPHPLLAPGPRNGVAGLMDVAPTIADLLGIREPTPWLGHSLVRGERPGAVITHHRDATVFAETDAHSLVLDPRDDAFHLFDAASDPLQAHDLAAQRPEVVEELRTRIDEETRLNDYLIEVDRVWRP